MVKIDATKYTVANLIPEKDGIGKGLQLHSRYVVLHDVIVYENTLRIL